MKTKKIFAALLASTMAAGTLASLSVSAAYPTVMGDVDMDGIVTGHDAAMVSRYLDSEGDIDSLSAPQLMYADVNGNGWVDEEDAALIFESADYALGDIDNRTGSKKLSLPTARVALLYTAKANAGIAVETVASDAVPGEFDVDDVFNRLKTENKIDQRVYNLIDVNGDGIVNFNDVMTYVIAYSTEILIAEPYIYLEEGCYYMDLDYLCSGATGIEISLSE